MNHKRMVVDPMMSREEECDGVIRPPRDDNDHDDDDEEVRTTTAPRKTKDGTSPFLFHDPRQFIEYCLCTLYSASQLDSSSSSSSSSTTGHGDFHPSIRREWKEMISEKIADALQQDPTLAGAEFQTQQQQNMPHQPLLHWVCHFGLTLELIRYISRLCPSAIMHSRVGLQDHYCYPIAQALQNYDTPMETIIFLLFHDDDEDDDDHDHDERSRNSRRNSKRKRRNYPQATIHSILRRVLTRYPLSDALPLLKRFLPNDAQQRDFFSSSIANNNHNHQNHNNNIIQFEYGYNHDIAADLLSYVAKLHGQSEYTWVFAAATSTVGRTGMLSIQVVVVEEEKEKEEVDGNEKTKTKTTIRVAVGSEYEIPRVIPRLLQIPDLHMVAIESPRISHCCWIQDFCNLLLMSSSSSSSYSSSSSKNNNHLTNENENDSCLGHVPPPLVLAGDYAAFGSVRRLSIRFQALTCETMDKLLVSIHSAMPNLRHLSLHNAWHGKLTESTGYSKLPLLFAANNNNNNNDDDNDGSSSSSSSLLLEEIQVVGDPLAWPYIMALLQRSTTLRKLEFIDKTFVMDADQAIQLASVLRNNKILQELHVDSQFQDMSSFEARLIESLNINTTLKVLRLPQLLMINNNNNKDPASSGRNQAGEDDLLVDLVRLQKNTTLEKIVVGSTSTTTTTTITTTDDTRNDMLQYWCSRNRLLTSLYDESLRLQEAIVIATPYHLFDVLPWSCNEDPTTTSSSTTTTTTKENTAAASVSSSAEQLPSSSSRRRSCIISGVKRPRATTGGTTSSSNTGTTNATTTPSAPAPPAALLLEDSYRCSLAYEMIRCRPDLWRVQQEQQQQQQQQQQQLVKKPPPPPPPPPTSSSCATGLPNENNNNSARVS